MLVDIIIYVPVFRWKGENVATTEVTEILGLVDFVQEVSVYGVKIPGMFFSTCNPNKSYGTYFQKISPSTMKMPALHNH